MVHQRKISVTGLGYVGLTIANEFGHQDEVIGYDKNAVRIAELKSGFDRNHELSLDQLNNTKIHYTDNPDDLREADFHIISVLTPIDEANRPDFSILASASKTVGKELKKGDIVVYESTVYPGATEEKCIPILEKASHLKCGEDFFVGYSPERINPADKEHTFTNIPKVVAAINKKTLDIISKVYGSVVKAGVCKVSCIRVAEATKVVENTQRDVNISLMNEVALILQCLGMESSEVISAASTKWNFIPFHPGLVGGHCIGVNSYYLTYKAEELGYHPDVILAGRRVNDSMTKFLADKTIKNLIHLNVPIKYARIGVFGLTYKENYPDLHDSRIMNLIDELKSYETEVIVHDPIADPKLARIDYGIELEHLDKLNNLDAIVLAVAHKEYLSLTMDQLKKMLKRPGLIMDVKGILAPQEFTKDGITVWRL